MLPRRLLAPAAVAAVAGAAAPAPAAGAHTEVVKRSPAPGAKLERSKVHRVTVAFSGALRKGSIRVTGPRGVASKGRGGRDPRSVQRIRVHLRSGLAEGRYRVTWSATSADGHEQTGSFAFRLR